MSDPYQNKAESYVHRDYKGTYSLISQFLETHMKENYPIHQRESFTAIDVGCGTGSSTRLFKELGFCNIVGIDPSLSMIEQARKFDPFGRYHLMLQADNLQNYTSQYDLVISSFVLPALSSETKLIQHFSLLQNLLNEKGRGIIITASINAFDPQYSWVSWTQDFPENMSITNGSPVRVRLCDTGLILEDTAWTSDYLTSIMLSCQLKIIGVFHSIAENHDIQWKSETLVSPFEIYVIKRS